MLLLQRSLATAPPIVDQNDADGRSLPHLEPGELDVRVDRGEPELQNERDLRAAMHLGQNE